MLIYRKVESVHTFIEIQFVFFFVVEWPSPGVPLKVGVEASNVRLWKKITISYGKKVVKGHRGAKFNVNDLESTRELSFSWKTNLNTFWQWYILSTPFKICHIQWNTCTCPRLSSSSLKFHGKVMEQYPWASGCNYSGSSKSHIKEMGPNHSKMIIQMLFQFMKERSHSKLAK